MKTSSKIALGVGIPVAIIAVILGLVFYEINSLTTHNDNCNNLRTNWYNEINSWIARKNSLGGAIDFDGSVEAQRQSLGAQFNDISRQCGNNDSDESWLNAIGMRLVH